MPDDIRTARFHQLVMPHLDAAYNLALWLTRHPADAEDVAQEAMLRAFRAIEGCRDATAKPWLLRIVRNLAYDRQKVAGQEGLTGFADLDPEDGLGSAFVEDVFARPADSPEGLLLRAETSRQVEAMIGRLPPPLREVIVLRELEDLSYREIAEVAAIPIGTVMSRLARARGLLQTAWSEIDG